MNPYEAAVVEFARLGGTLARAAFQAERKMEAQEKAGHFDIVTQTDRQVEMAIIESIEKRFPHSRILGEEGGMRGEGELLWIIDPIDGTSNFASGLPIFATTLRVEDRSGPLAAATYDPMRDELFSLAGDTLRCNGTPWRWDDQPLAPAHGELLTNAPYEGTPLAGVELERFSRSLRRFRAVRRLGSCALHVAYVAAGRAAACYEYSFHPWDIAAGLAFAQASGCRFFGADRQGRLVDDPVRDPLNVARILVSAPGLRLDPADYGIGP